MLLARMATTSNFWMSWMLPGVLMVLAMLSIWSWWVQPENTLIAFARIPIGAQSSVVLTNLSDQAAHADPTSAWRLQLCLDPALRAPGPEWLMFEGFKPGDGYELHWLPQELGLQLFRVQEDEIMLLASIRLERFPAQLVFARRAYRLEVWADGRRVLHVLDPLPTPPPVAWGFKAAGSMDDSSISLHDDRRLVDDQVQAGLRLDAADLGPLIREPGRSDHAILAVRHALAMDPEKTAGDMATALEEAGAAVDALTRRDDDRAILEHWLAWGEVRLALAWDEDSLAESADRDGDAAHTRAALDQLAVLAHQTPVGASPGLLLDILDRLAAVSVLPPHGSTADILRWRDAWLSALSAAAQTADDEPLLILSDDWRWQLRLLAHAADCLRGRPPRPTPGEAPDWVIQLWRAFAGGDPGSPTFASSLPILPEDRNPIRPAVERLIQAADFEPAAAVIMRARILAALEGAGSAAATGGGDLLDANEVSSDARRAAEQAALAALKAAPAHEAVLAEALLALHGIGDAGSALHDLDSDPRHASPAEDGAIPWARRDPLAYALYRLILHRFSDAKGGMGLSPLAPHDELPEALAPYSRLLTGRPDATDAAWLTDLSPDRALAAALAMQEVLGPPHAAGASRGHEGGGPNWSLLDQVPCFTLPLQLMKRSGSDAVPGTLP
jgi:hypothetical protein